MTSPRLSLKRMPVAEVMATEVKTIEAGMSVEDCIGLMRDNDIGCAVVIDKGVPVGIFTERDLLRSAAYGPERLGLTMREVMSRPLKTIPPTSTLWEAIEVMNKARIRHLPIVEGERLVGVLTERDLMRLFFSHKDLLLSAISLEETRRFMLG